MTKPSRRTLETSTSPAPTPETTPATPPVLDAQAGAAQSAPEREPFEVIAARLGTPAHVLAMTRTHKGWVAGREVTETEFRAATAAVLSVTPGRKATPEDPKDEVTTNG